MKRIRFFSVLVFTGLVIAALLYISGCQIKNGKDSVAENKFPDYTGSVSCRECHEKFYELWASSHHGLAMQPITNTFLQNEITPQIEEIFLEGKHYQAMVQDTFLFVKERSQEKLKNYQATWALGGKNVYYFLTPITKGRLQVLPLAYDLNDSIWYNNPESAIRHFSNEMLDEAISWKDYLYTFNTTCYSCHVSQLSSNFDLTTLSYNTLWKEAGINCETCHGPCSEHIRVCKEAGEGNVPEDLKIIITKTFTHDQHNSSCASCHAKMRPLTSSYPPGETFFNHFDLITLEHPDFYPDGRDLGENYTHTTWLQSKCVQSGQLDCIHCHTSSGRYRFKTGNPNFACMPCHQDKVDNVSKHSFHLVESEGSLCISCHMPKTEFGRMIRSDHSMRPPMPAATIKFKSPNACNICHKDKDARWSDQFVREWRKRDYQKEVLYQGELIAEARQGKWGKVEIMLKYLNERIFDEVFSTSMIRLLSGYDSENKWPGLLRAINHPSPLVRSSAAAGLLGNFTIESKNALLKAAHDEYRLVRLEAAAALSSFPRNLFSPEEKRVLNTLFAEYEESLVTRPDDWGSHYNLGNYFYYQGNFQEAILSFETANCLYPDAFEPLINSSLAYAMLGNSVKAEENLRKAIVINPDNEASHLNLGLLLAELGRLDEAENSLRTAFEANPESATAAYNLSILTAKKDIREAIKWSKKASVLNPEDSKYGYTYAFYLLENKDKTGAIKELRKTLHVQPDYSDAIFLLGNIYEESGEIQKALELYNNSLKQPGLSDEARYQLNLKIDRMRNN